MKGHFMIREMRRKERQLDDTASMEILTCGDFGILSTYGSNSYPYATPLSYVYFNSCIYFHCAIEGLKIDNIDNNNKVCFCVTSIVALNPEKFSVKYKSVIVFGTASEIFYPEKDEALKELIKKYSGEFTEKAGKYIESSKDKTRVFKIEIEHITGKSNIKLDG
jgi:nitroimidazol reductase NimA-like FMN-containing flavoprotein (pyridoxamine 5'-phosphate oxidase superfamily)